MFWEIFGLYLDWSPTLELKVKHLERGFFFFLIFDFKASFHFTFILIVGGYRQFNIHKYNLHSTTISISFESAIVITNRQFISIDQKKPPIHYYWNHKTC